MIQSQPVTLYNPVTGQTTLTWDHVDYTNRHRWHPAVNGGGKRPWFVMRERRPCERLAPYSPLADYHRRADGEIRRFASRATALGIAQALNQSVCAS